MAVVTHRVVLDQVDRRALERSGWRTLLEYRENQVRGRDGRLLCVEARWIAEAERVRDPSVVATASAETAEAAWAELRRAAARVPHRRTRRHHEVSTSA